MDPKSYTLMNIVKKLTGPTEPIGDHNTDTNRLENLKEFTSLLHYMIDDMLELAKYKDSQQDSMKKIGKYAYSTLKDIKASIDEIACNHKWVQDKRHTDSAICDKCDMPGPWFCPNSPNGLCDYGKHGHDECTYCGDPEERK